LVPHAASTSASPSTKIVPSVFISTPQKFRIAL
jgi:hypothetical protein